MAVISIFLPISVSLPLFVFLLYVFMLIIYSILEAEEKGTAILSSFFPDLLFPFLLFLFFFPPPRPHDVIDKTSA